MSAAVDTVRKSEDYCREILRQANTSFALPFITLPKRKRLAFEVIYAFMRLCDDASDDADAKNRADRLAAWRANLRAALRGEVLAHPVLPALAFVTKEFAIDGALLEELIDGTEMDLTIRRYADFDALYKYCYRVASVVGLVSLRIFGIKEPSAERWESAAVHAEACGIAFQLTNILRDVREDAERDRIYLPLADLERHGLTEDDVLRGRTDDRFLGLMKEFVAKAETYYAKSAPLAEMLPADARPCLSTMRGIYHGILEKIVAQDYDVWSERARGPTLKKLGIAAKAYFLRRNA